MATEKVQHLYEEIRELTSQIGELGLPEFFMERAKTIMDPSWLEEDGNFSVEGADLYEEALTQELMNKAPELYTRMQSFFGEYNEAEDPDADESPVYCEVIFDSEPWDDPDLVKYDPNEVDPINLCFLIVFGYGAISHYELFMNEEEFPPFVREKNSELADFLEDGFLFNSFFDLAQFVCNVNRF